jgi:hypothetical protein
MSFEILYGLVCVLFTPKNVKRMQSPLLPNYVNGKQSPLLPNYVNGKQLPLLPNYVNGMQSRSATPV